MAAMYIRNDRPEKLVTLAKEMVNQNHFVASGLMTYWAKLLVAGDLIAESQEVLDARDVMNELRSKWIENMRKKGKWVIKPRKHIGDSPRAESRMELGADAETKTETDWGDENAQYEGDEERGSVPEEERR